MSEQNLIKEIKTLKKKLLDSYDKKPIIYIGYTEENICKFGFTNDIKTRLEKHKIQINKDFMPEYIVETIYNREVEKDIKRDLSHRIISKIYNSKNQTELIRLDSELNIHKLHKLIISYKKSYIDKEIIVKLTNELEELYSKKNEKEEEIEEIKEVINFKEEKIDKIKKGLKFGCSLCEYTSYKKSHVVRHINKKKSCGQGIKEIVEIPVEIMCKFCNKNFSTKENLNDHTKKNCKHKDRAKDEEIK